MISGSALPADPSLFVQVLLNGLQISLLVLVKIVFMALFQAELDVFQKMPVFWPLTRSKSYILSKVHLPMRQE